MKNLIVNILNDDIIEIVVDKKRLALIPPAVTQYQLEGFTILFTVKESLTDFQKEIGSQLSKTFVDIPTQSVVDEADPNFYELLGKMILDYYVPTTYYIKSHKDKAVYEVRGTND